MESKFHEKKRRKAILHIFFNNRNFTIKNLNQLLFDVSLLLLP